MNSPTGTTSDQVQAARVLLTLVSNFTALPAPDLRLRESYDSDTGLQWGICLALHGDLAAFEIWREALGINPATVQQSSGSGTSWLKARCEWAGTPLELTGFYTPSEDEGDVL